MEVTGVGRRGIRWEAAARAALPPLCNARSLLPPCTAHPPSSCSCLAVVPAFASDAYYVNKAGGRRTALLLGLLLTLRS